jgi:hypothetical protein
MQQHVLGMHQVHWQQQQQQASHVLQLQLPLPHPPGKTKEGAGLWTSGRIARRMLCFFFSRGGASGISQHFPLHGQIKEGESTTALLC